MPSIQRQLDDLARVAQSSVSVLILGETGTGKEVAARAVHARSGRSGPFVAVNCGAIATSLVESELFGYRKGAFSGANEDRSGLVRSSQGGTLFLDEIGDLALPAQAALLRVLQEGEVLPVGATKAVPVDLRIVAATHRDLERRIAALQFRADLLARLNGFTLQLPPLRERIEDLGLLIASMSSKLTRDRATLSFHVEAFRALARHAWPLNIRELEQCLRSAAVLSSGRIDLEHLPESVRTPPGDRAASSPPTPTPSAPAPALPPEQAAHRQQLIELFAKHGGNLSAVARELGKDRVQIRRWLKIYGIDPSGS